MTLTVFDVFITSHFLQALNFIHSSTHTMHGTGFASDQQYK